MAKILIVTLAAFVFTAQSAVIQTKEAVHKRIERSPCHTCDEAGQFGPPPPPGPPPSPPPPPGIFRANQWSGLVRNSNQHGVFSGASASIGGGSQAGGEALSLASTIDNSPSTQFDRQKSNAGSGFNDASSQSSSQSQSSSFGGQSGSSAGSNANAGGFGGQSSSRSESQSSGRGDYDGQSSVNSNSQSSAGGFVGQSSSSSKSAAGSNSFSSNSFGNKNHVGGNGGAHSQHEQFGYQEFHSSQSGRLDDIGHINSNTGSSGFSGGEQQSAGFGGSQQQQQSIGFGQQESKDYGSSSSSFGNSGNTQRTSSGGFGGSTNEQGYGGGYHKSQSSLNEAFKLANQGLETAGQSSGCSSCGRSGGYALSNAKSDSGNAIALSVSG